ncbi:GNAT family N-acetyltransferase [Vibrio aquimaris]|uniref:Acetyltransferase (GNAT) family protein n=1 Tax=Vibrio aquimaris TaxID=2587862 RepID=A0A5P9CJ96_9VIBR|nr:GNAT family N-acetyltransferase [Vibrio aquimaris]QFT26081.1 Acetyltransferase (GNAT) family protein [Vibrio aquimaris]
MVIRKAVKTDAKTLLQFIKLKAEFDRSMKGFSGEVAATVEKIERALFVDTPYAYALLLELDETVLGFALYHYRYSSFSGYASIWLDDLLVLGGERSKGYGQQLMLAMREQADAELVSHIAWTASPYNIRAHDFYKKLGAEIERMEGQRPYFRWELT